MMSRTIILEGDYDAEDWYQEVRLDGTVLTPERSQKVYNHSPDGFAWGYEGSGPAQLALAVLLAAGVAAREAVTLHQRFKRAFIARLPRDSFNVEIPLWEWIERERQEAP